MARGLWPLAVVGAFVVGWAAAGAVGRTTGARDAAREAEHLKQQVSTLQARLHAREELAAARAAASSPDARAPSAPRASADRGLTAAVREERLLQDLRARGGAAAERPVSSRSGPSATPTVEVALDRFYRYLEATRATALMKVLAAGNDSDERRAAARLLGSLQIPQSLPLLKDIIQNDDDVLLRRAAAAGLRQLQTPESIPVMEHILANAGDDRFVRLSAAYGLAESGRPLGVIGLTQIFQESAADGRGRDMAFRALTSLNDERPLPFMRQVVASEAEPSYRLRAIQYLTAQGDRQSLPTLQVLMQSPTEQASIRDAAAQAYRTLGGK